MTDPAGSNWAWTYDLRGNRITSVDPDAGASSATHDGAGNMLTTTDARGQVIATTYDQLNRRTATYSGSTSGPLLTSWTYDTVRKGAVTTSASYVGSTPGTPGAAYTDTVVTYNAAGDVTKSTISIPTAAPAFGGTTYTTTASYYADSSLSVKGVPAIGGLPAEQIIHSYDAWGRLNGVRGNNGILSGTVYNPIGQLTQFNRLHQGAEAYSGYGRDPVTGEVMGIEDSTVVNGVGKYVADRTYTRDLSGNVTSAATYSDLPTPRTQVYCYKYDALRQLTSTWSPNAQSACSQTPTASALSGPAPLWVDYAYDTTTGNRTTVTTHASNSTIKTANYTYAAAGTARPHGVTSISGDATLGAGAYGTDAAGNVTAMPGKSLTYNEIGKVASVTAGSATQTQIYDAGGNLLLRISSVEGAALFLGETVISRKASGTALYGARTYGAASGIPVAERTANSDVTGSVVSWLFTDITGTVDTRTVATNGATQQVFRDPFGTPLAGANAFWDTGNGYLDKPGTASTGLTSVGARTYDTALGKFLSPDPLTDPANPQQNLGYAYGHNNPLVSPDPTGLAPMMLSDGCGGGACSKAADVKWAKGKKTTTTSASAAATTPHSSTPPKPDGSIRAKSELVVPIAGVVGWGPTLTGLAGTEAAARNEWLRRLNNVAGNAIGFNVAKLLGADCAAAANGMMLCTKAIMNPAGPGTGGTTFGEYFITADEAVSKETMQHELRHAEQWSGWGGMYIAAYGVAAATSMIATGTYGCANYFEIDAGLANGGYRGC